LFEYFAKDRLRLTEKTLQSETQNIKDKKYDLESLINISFLSNELRKKYLELLSDRYKRLLE